jgi:HK97 gp10 family phage protein
VTKFSFDREGYRLAMKQGMVDGSNAVRLVASRIVRKELSKRGTGRRYRVSGGKKNGRNLRARGIHVASAPGQPPAVNTNRLRASWSLVANGMGVTGSSDSTVGMQTTRTGVLLWFGSNLRYARFLEFGTARMKPRPYIRPVMAAVSNSAVKIMRDQIARQINRYRRSGLFRPNAT